MNKNPRKGIANPKAKLAPKAKGQAKMSSSSQQECAVHLTTYAKQFMLPGESDGHRLLTSPASGSHQMCVRHLHRVIDVSSATLPNGFTCVMRPDLTSPGFITSSANTATPAVPGLVSVSGPGVGLNNGAGEWDPNQKLIVEDVTGKQNIIKFTSVADAAAVSRTAITITPLPASEVGFVFTWKNQNRFTVVTKTAAGNWVNLFSRQGAQGNVQTASVTLPANTTHIGFHFNEGPALAFPRVDMTINIASGQVTTLAVDAIAPAFPAFILDSQITVGRVISMSVLASNTSADVAKGGNINVARVPHTQSVFSQVPASIALLPSNRRYQGPAATGGYAWWMPSQLDQFEPNEVHHMAEALDEADFLLVNVEGWAPGAGLGNSTFRIQFDWIVEFYTPSQLFEKIQTPPIFPGFEELFHQLLTMPAATHNPGHIEAVKDFLKGAMGAARGAAAFYQDNHQVINALLSAVAKALL